MSNTTTPTRPGRGIVVPGIDTSSIYDHKPAQQSQSFNGWPLTPPQSAQESRRPSLACSLMSDAHSGPSSISSYSQPATPVHSMANSAENFGQQWHDTAEMHVMPGHIDTTCAMNAPPMYSASFPQHGLHMTTQDMSMQMPTASPAPTNHWQQHAHHGSFGASVQHGLTDTLYQSTQGLGQHVAPQASMYANPSTSVVASLDQSAFPNYDSNAHVAGSFSQPPQVVVPSQLGPQDDYQMDQYPSYSQEDDMVHEFAQSFDANAGHGGWQSVGPESPIEAYMGPSDDDEYVLVKDEYTGTPSRSSNYRGHQPSPLQKRHSKKARKSLASGKAFCEFSTPHFDVRCEGSPFVVDPNTGRIIPSSVGPRNSKPHKCHAMKADGKTACGASFDRSEHLKRHAVSHTDERPYPCPLPDCKKRIGRPDNAGDHFKTHLKGHSKGKRNNHVSFETLQDAILNHPAYDDKKATKLLNNLKKFLITHEELQREEQMRRQMEVTDRHMSRR